MKQVHSSKNKFKTLNDLYSQEPVWRILENFFHMELKRKFEKEFPCRYFLRHRIYENPNEQLDNNILQYYIE